MHKPAVQLIKEAPTQLLVKLTALAADKHAIVVVMDRNFNIIYSNGRLEEMIEITPHNLIKSSFSQILVKMAKTAEHNDPSYQNDWLAGIFKLLIDNNSWSGDMEYAINQNKIINLNTNLVPHIEEDGNLQHIICIQTDISTHKQLSTQLSVSNQELNNHLEIEKTALQESKDRFNLALKAIGDGVWDWNIHTGEIYFSERWKSMLGYKKNEIEHPFYAWQQLIHPDDLGNMLMTWIHYVEGTLDNYQLEYKMKTKDGSYIWVQSKGVCQFDEHGTPCRMAGSHTDVDKQKITENELEQYHQHLEELVADRTRELAQANESLRRLATLDGLTGLPNRRTFDSTLEHEWKRCKQENIPLALVMIDVDFFKNYNDTFGHQAGDNVLIKVAAAFAKTLKRPTDFVARYGGEEFCMILPMADSIGAEKMAEEARLAIESLAMPTANPVVSPCVTVSLGIAVCIPDINNEEINYDTLLHAADDALYEAKERGRNRCNLSSFDIGANLKQEQAHNVTPLIDKNDFYAAMDKAQLRLMFQPQYNVVNQSLFCFETLIRWNHPNSGSISPGQFFPQANQHGIMPQLDKWVITHAIKSFKNLEKESQPDFCFSINLSEQLLKETETPEFIISQLQEYGISSNNIEFEISEHILLNRLYEQRWQPFDELGLRLVVDQCTIDGIRSGMFNRLPVYALKINLSELQSMGNDDLPFIENKTLLDCIYSIDQEKTRLTIQGIENAEQYAQMLQIGCKNMQGFYFYRPLTDEDLINHFSGKHKIKTGNWGN
jgi:diguanylate cyclase (GGDEF)-like protein/PAS domain S-box-containing protein